MRSLSKAATDALVKDIAARLSNDAIPIPDVSASGVAGFASAFRFRQSPTADSVSKFDDNPPPVKPKDAFDSVAQLVVQHVED